MIHSQTLPRSQAQPVERTVSRRRQRITAFYVLIAPWLLGFIFLGIIPLALGLATSFTNYDGLNINNLKFVGTRNYERILADNDAGYALRQTVVWSMLNVPLWLVASFGIAFLVSKIRAGQSIFRTLLYLPSVVPVVAVIWIWRIFLDRNAGLLNGFLGLFSPGIAVAWMTDYALLSVTVISVWTGIGGGMVVFLAGLQGIPQELEEAAQIDGANRWQVLWNITIPFMSPVIFFQLLMSLIGSLQTLVLPMLLTGTGGVPRGVYLYMYHTYNQIFQQQRFGYGTALLWVLFVVILILTVVVFRTARYWVFYETSPEGENA
jgi:multiple sugar transport system permease protein